MVDPLGMAAALQSGVYRIGPALPPYLGFGVIVPVGGGDGFTFIRTLLFIVNLVAVAVENVFLLLLVAPCPVLANRAQGQHDMGVRVPVAFIVNTDIGAHSGFNEMPMCVIANERDVLLPR